MKTKALGILTTLILGLWTTSGNGQTYYYSGPVTGYVNAYLDGYGPIEGRWGTSGFQVNFGTISETLTYNPVAQTLEQSGTVTLSPSIGSFAIDTPSPIDGPDPEGTATLTVGNNGSVSFDTISTPVAGSPGAVASYAAPAIQIPVTGVGVYNGQAFSATWNIEIAGLETDILAGSPTSLTFNQEPYNNPVMAPPDYYGESGFSIGNGLNTGSGPDGDYLGYWDINSAVATTVPEPNSLALVAFGIPAIYFLRRTKFIQL